MSGTCCNQSRYHSNCSSSNNFPIWLNESKGLSPVYAQSLHFVFSNNPQGTTAFHKKMTKTIQTLIFILATGCCDWYEWIATYLKHLEIYNCCWTLIIPKIIYMWIMYDLGLTGTLLAQQDHEKLVTKWSDVTKNPMMGLYIYNALMMNS